MSIIRTDERSAGGRPARTRLAGALVLMALVAGAAYLASGGVVSFGRHGEAAGGTPRVQFMHGILVSEGTGSMRLGKMALVFTSTSGIVLDGRAVTADELADGQEATVMGRPYDGRFVVEQCTANEPVPASRQEQEGLQRSTEDPTVGWGRSPS